MVLQLVLVDDRIKQLKLLFKVLESEPQSAYSAFVGSFKEKLTYFTRIIPSLGGFLKPLEDVIRFNFIPAITDGQLCSDSDSILLSLPRSNRPEVFCKKGVLRNFTKFTGKHLCQTLFLIKLHA